jgi:secreted trypsin-like serine protease
MAHFLFSSLCLSLVLHQLQARSFCSAVETRNLVIGGDEAEQGWHPYMISLHTASK